jgi:chloramphenicol 3-O-phosphotransferase
MASGIFIGLSESDILAIRDKAVAMFKEGKTIMSYSDSGSNVSKQFVMSPKEVLAECNQALKLLDPETYGVRTTIIRTDYRRFDGF